MATFKAHVQVLHSLVLLPGALFWIVFLQSGVSIDEEPEGARGSIIAVEVLEELTKEEIAVHLKAFGVPGRPEYAVSRFRIEYHTIDHLGVPAIASGSVVIPEQFGSALPLLSFQHGTTVAKKRAPSQQQIDLIGMGLGTSGYVTAFPDYLGLGSSSGLHPYVHAQSLSTAVVDFLRAVRVFCNDRGIALNDQLFLMGYSEGGYATLAAHRAIQEEYSSEFTVAASAPMAGPYHLSGVMMETILAGKPYPSPMYLPFTLMAYRQIYPIFDTPDEVFKPEYAVLMDSLFSGELNLHEINKALPEVPLAMLKDDFIHALKTDQHHPVREALAENDLHQWAPEAPVRLIHCKGDDQVDFANAEAALIGFSAHGATQVELVALEYGNHEECAPASILLGKMWFDQFKQNTECPAQIADNRQAEAGCRVMTTENRAGPSDL